MALQISSGDTCAKLSAAETPRVLLRVYSITLRAPSVVDQFFESFSAADQFAFKCMLLIKISTIKLGRTTLQFKWTAVSSIEVAL